MRSTKTDTQDLLRTMNSELKSLDDDNRLTVKINEGLVSRTVFGLIAAEEWHVVSSDWRCFHLLAARSDHRATRHWFAELAVAEETALDRLESFAVDAGIDPAELGTDHPHTDRQAYPAYCAWLAVNGEPSEVAFAIQANFASWARYCALAASGMRAHYGFSEEGCAFFDFFAESKPIDTAVAAIAAGLEAGTSNVGRARHYARVLSAYELGFWNSYVDPEPGATSTADPGRPHG